MRGVGNTSGGVDLYLGTFPPRQCGIATFTRDLADAVSRANGNRAEVVAVDDAATGTAYAYPDGVVHSLAQHDRYSYADTARFINAHPAQALNVQHEFGIFGGRDGEWLFDVLERLRKPPVVTLHTVVVRPTLDHAARVRRLCSHAAQVVVLSQTGRELLEGVYGVDSAHVRVIPHGVPDVAFEPTERFKRLFGFEGRFVASTFGLLSRGKGLEAALEGIARTSRRLPEILYVILGATHPVVARHEGETYRDELQARIQALRIERNVLFVDRYLSLTDLLLYLAASDAYMTPYVNPDQVVSGTLAYAVGAGKPVVSTPYLYARELLAGGRGVIVPFGDSTAIGDALSELATREQYRLDMARNAYAFGRSMIWSTVGRRYAHLLNEVAPARRAAS